MSIKDSSRSAKGVSKSAVVTVACPAAEQRLSVADLPALLQADIAARTLLQAEKRVTFRGLAAPSHAPEADGEPAWQIDLAAFDILPDVAKRTSHEHEQQTCWEVCAALDRAQHVVREPVTRLYDASLQRFLVASEVTGTCPACGLQVAAGSHCATSETPHDPLQLDQRRSLASGEVPEVRIATRLSLSDSHLAEILGHWLATGTLPPGDAVRWLQQHLANATGLRLGECTPTSAAIGGAPPKEGVCLTIDSEYAVIVRVLAGIEQSRGAAQGGTKWSQQRRQANAERIHCAGSYLAAHAHIQLCLWPAVLIGAGLQPPSQLLCHGSVGDDRPPAPAGTRRQLSAAQLAELIPAEAIRYYLASKLDGGCGDIVLSLRELVETVNRQLVDTILRIAERTAGQLAARFQNAFADELDEWGTYQDLLQQAGHVSAALHRQDTTEALRAIGELARKTNDYLDRREPESAAHDDDIAHRIISQALLHFRAICLLLVPVVPSLARRALAMLGESEPFDRRPAAISDPPLTRRIGVYQPLLAPLDLARIEASIGDAAWV